MSFLANIGLVISLTFPLVISIYKETRYVSKKNLLVYGISLVIFTLSYSAYELPENFKHLKWLSWTFFLLGLLMIFLYIYDDKNPIDMNNPSSLIFSWKNFGAFEIAFILPVFFNPTPTLFSPTNFPIFNLGLSLIIVFWIFSGGFWIYRNWIKNNFKGNYFIFLNPNIACNSIKQTFYV